MLLESIPLIGSLLKSITDVVGKVVPDKDLAAKLSSEIQDRLINVDAQILQAQLNAQASVVLAEAKGESWIQRSWRPCLMYLFMLIIFNNFILAPYLINFWPKVPNLPLPPEMWALLKIGMGGYIVSRGAEKVADSIASRGK